MDTKTLMIGGLIIVLMISMGVIPDFIGLGIGPQETTGDLGGDDDDTGEDGDIQDNSSLTVGTGYVDGEGNLVTPGEVAQSVYWAGTSQEVADVFVEPTLHVVHSDLVVELTDVSYQVSVPLIQVQIAGQEEYYQTQYTESITQHVYNLPADGGSLGTTTMLGDIFGIDVSTGIGSEVLEDFLWAMIADMGVDVSSVYVDAGTFTIEVDVIFQIDTIAINYGLSLMANETEVVNTGTYTASASFVNTLYLDLIFTVEPPPPEAPVITFSTPVCNPDPRYSLGSGSNTITITFTPSWDVGEPSSYSCTFNGDYFQQNIPWDGNPITITKTINVDSSMENYKFVLSVTVINQGVSASKSQSVMYTYVVAESDGGGDTGDDGIGDVTDPITSLDVTFSAYFPSSLGGDPTLKIVLLGGAGILFVGLMYKAKTEGLNRPGMKKIRKRKNRKKRR
jgi:hypothetical protein